MMQTTFVKVSIFNNPLGYAEFHEEHIAMPFGEPHTLLSDKFPATYCQLRHSPVGFDNTFHVCASPIWVIILQGIMEIILQDGTSRRFNSGDSFYAADVLPGGADFDANIHGHRSRQIGPDPLVTMFIRE